MSLFAELYPGEAPPEPGRVGMIVNPVGRGERSDVLQYLRRQGLSLSNISYLMEDYLGKNFRGDFLWSTPRAAAAAKTGDINLLTAEPYLETNKLRYWQPDPELGVGCMWLYTPGEVIPWFNLYTGDYRKERPIGLTLYSGPVMRFETAISEEFDDVEVYGWVSDSTDAVVGWY